jgi:hypothetical protein
MKFNEIFPEFEAGKPIRRKSWPANAYINKKYNSKLSVAEMILQIADADDWEIYVERPFDEFLEEMKQYLYHDLEFYKNRQSRYYPEENMDIADIWNVIHNYYIDKDVIRELLKFIKDNNLAKKR